MGYNSDIKKKLYNYFISRLGMHDYRRNWMKGDCPNCGKEQKFGVNISQNRSNCFSCGYNDIPLKVIMKVELLQTPNEALKYLNDNAGDLEYYEKKVEVLVQKTEVSLPESYRLITRGNSMLGKMARKYVLSRGFDLDDLVDMGIGYCTEGDYKGYIIIPFYRNGVLIYYNARIFFGDGPKYNNPNTEDFGVGKNLLIYNIEALFLYNKVFLFEGAFNALTIGEQGISSGGKHLSPYQISLIIKSPVEKVVIMLDDDAYEKAINLALELVPYKKVKVIKFPYKIDANDLGKAKTLKLSHKTPYMNYNELLKLRNEHKRALITYSY